MVQPDPLVNDDGQLQVHSDDDNREHEQTIAQQRPGVAGCAVAVQAVGA